MSKTVTVKGLDELKRTLAELAPNVATSVLRGAIFDIAREIRDDAKQRAPRRTGRLRRAIIAQRRQGSKDRLRASVDVKAGQGAKPDAFYWKFLEFGTSNIAARPSIRPAFDNLAATFDARFARVIGARIEKAMMKK